MKPKRIIDHLEKCKPLPKGLEERFNGYGVMGLPFTTGHILGMRRFPASSLGEGYTSVWHSDPEGRWTFYQNVSPEKSCTRYFGCMVSRAELAEIDISWTADLDFSMTVEGSRQLQWQVSLGHTGFVWRRKYCARSPVEESYCPSFHGKASLPGLRCRAHQSCGPVA